MQSERSKKGLHAALIMDGNGRWAQARGLPRTAGHLAGVSAVRRVVEAAPAHGIEVLTLYAFSSDNWKRPGPEVHALMRLLERYLRTELASCVRQGVRLEVLGRRDRLPARVVESIARAECATAAGTTLRLRLAIDYSSRDAIVQAAMKVAERGLSMNECPRAAIMERLATHADRSASDVDLLIRTGGEQRLSDFLLWECAYAELYFTETAWPDFDAVALTAAMAEFHRRQRRFGGLVGSVPVLDQAKAVALRDDPSVVRRVG
jgi:undecaprenyl diphosphate synthase